MVEKDEVACVPYEHRGVQLGEEAGCETGDKEIGMDSLFDRYINFVHCLCLPAILFEIVGLILVGLDNPICRYFVLVPAIVMAVLTVILVIAIQIKEHFFDRRH